MDPINDRMTLGVVATLVQDLYYQDFAGRDAFIGDEQIMPLIAMAYARMLNEDYKTAKALNRAMMGFSWIEISSDWLSEPEIITVSKQSNGVISGELSKRVFSFDFDSMSSAIQNVFPADGSACGQLIRISQLDRWKMCRLPYNEKVFYIVNGSKIEIITQGGYPKKLSVQYVPTLWPLDDTTTVALTRSDELVKNTLQLLLIAKDKVVVDKSNDSNPNTTIQTEIDAESLR